MQVRWLGERKRIFNIHFRNISGGLHNFTEVWPDEGDVDMFELASALDDVGYQYMVRHQLHVENVHNNSSIEKLDRVFNA